MRLDGHMSAGPTLADAPLPIPGAPVPDAGAGWPERQLAILAQLAEAGLEIALALKARIVETAAPKSETEAADAGSARALACADLARAFDRASRAVRLSIALRERVLKDAAAGCASAEEARKQRAGRVQRIVGRIVRTQHAGAAMRQALERAASERLFDADITGDLGGRSIGAVVAQICADLGLTPPWLALADEAWAQAEIGERPPGSPYAAWPDLPPEAFGGEGPEPEDPDGLEDGDEDRDVDDGDEGPDGPRAGWPSGRPAARRADE